MESRGHRTSGRTVSSVIGCIRDGGGKGWGYSLCPRRTRGWSTPMKFRNGRDKDFHAAIRARVGAYFESRGVTRHGDRRVLLKGLLLVAVTGGLYILILSNRL